MDAGESFLLILRVGVGMGTQVSTLSHQFVITISIHPREALHRLRAALHQALVGMLLV